MIFSIFIRLWRACQPLADLCLFVCLWLWWDFKFLLTINISTNSLQSKPLQPVFIKKQGFPDSHISYFLL